MSNERRHEEERREVRRVFIDAEEVIIRADRVKVIGDEERKHERKEEQKTSILVVIIFSTKG